VEGEPVLEIVLKGINMEVHRGELAAVVGTVGSDKSSLMSHITGEMDKVSGKVSQCYFICKTDILVYRRTFLFAHSFVATFFLFLKNSLCDILKEKMQGLPWFICKLTKLGTHLVQSQVSQLGIQF
jgi:ABC-type polysaccharide/polyol phosphate transport system ATPase subunit